MPREHGIWPVSHLNRMPHHSGVTGVSSLCLAQVALWLTHLAPGQFASMLSAGTCIPGIHNAVGVLKGSPSERGLCAALALVLPFTPSTEVLLIPSAELSALVEVKWLKWHRGRLLRAWPSKWEPFNKSLAINRISSFQVAVKKAPSMCCTKPHCCWPGAAEGPGAFPVWV